MLQGPALLDEPSSKPVQVRVEGAASRLQQLLGVRLLVAALVVWSAERRAGLASPKTVKELAQPPARHPSLNTQGGIWTRKSRERSAGDKGTSTKGEKGSTMASRSWPPGRRRAFISVIKVMGREQRSSTLRQLMQSKGPGMPSSNAQR